jgi:hypothetical protein
MSPMIDDESRRNDVERDLVAANLVRDFFTRRARERSAVQRVGHPRYFRPITDEDKAFARMAGFLRGVRLRDDDFSRMFFDAFGGLVEAIEREIAVRNLVRAFFTDRANARQARASDPDRPS